MHETSHPRAPRIAFVILFTLTTGCVTTRDRLQACNDNQASSCATLEQECFNVVTGDGATVAQRCQHASNYYIKRGDWKRALPLLEQECKHQDADNQGFSCESYGLALLGRDFFKRSTVPASLPRRPEVALAVCKETEFGTSSTSPRYPLFCRVLALEFLGRLDEAAAIYKRWCSEMPNFALNRRAGACAELERIDAARGAKVDTATTATLLLAECRRGPYDTGVSPNNGSWQAVGAINESCIKAYKRGVLPADEMRRYEAEFASAMERARADAQETQQRVEGYQRDTDEALARSAAERDRKIQQAVGTAASAVAKSLDDRAALERSLADQRARASGAGQSPASTAASTSRSPVGRPLAQPASSNVESVASRAQRAQSGLRSCIGHITPTNPVAPVIHWSAAASTFRNSIAKVDACWSAKGRRDTNDSCGRAVHSSDAKQWSRTHDEVRRLTRWADGLSSELKRECGYVFAPEWQVEFWCDNLSRDCLKELNTWLPVFAAWEKAETCLWYGDHRAAQAKACRDRVDTCERERGAKLDGPDPCTALR